MEIEKGCDTTYGIRCYTDGSKSSRGTGAGGCIMRDDKVTKTRAYGLTDSTTVFQGELHAIKMAANTIKEVTKPGEKVEIMCDSQAAIKALENYETTSALVSTTKLELNKACDTNPIIIKWIKAHVNHKGNEIGDRAAKTGCCLPTKEQIPVSRVFVKNKIKEELYNKWSRRWQTAPDCRQTFLFFPCTDQTKSKEVIRMNRYDLGIIVKIHHRVCTP